MSMLDDEFLERVFALPEHAGGVGQRKRDVPPVGWLLDLVPGGPSSFIHDGPPTPDHPVAAWRFCEPPRAPGRPTIRLKSVDLPTFGRPTRTTAGSDLCDIGAF